MQNIKKTSITGLGVLSIDISAPLVSQDKNLKQIIGELGVKDLLNFKNIRNFRQEFKFLNKICHTQDHDDALTVHDPIAFKMNRYSDIIPCKFSLELNTNTYQPIS